MQVPYTYEVTETDAKNNCATVVYKCEGQEDCVVGVRYMFENESIQDVIRLHAPTYLWQLKMAKTKPLIVGQSGSLAFDL